jgi:hypothetical protein
MSLNELPLNFLTFLSLYMLIVSILFINLAHSYKKDFLNLVYKFIPAELFNKLVGNPDEFHDVKNMLTKEGKGFTRFTLGLGGLMYLDHHIITAQREQESVIRERQFKTQVENGVLPHVASQVYNQPSQVGRSYFEMLSDGMKGWRRYYGASGHQQAGIPSSPSAYPSIYPHQSPYQPQFHPTSSAFPSSPDVSSSSYSPSSTSTPSTPSSLK